MVSESATYGTLILACATLILAIAYVIRRCQGIQFGTCCKLSVSQAEPPALGEPEPPGLGVPESPGLAMVVNEIVRRISKDKGRTAGLGGDDNNPPPESPNPRAEGVSQIV
jgi:hypothetical protein